MSGCAGPHRGDVVRIAPGAFQNCAAWQAKGLEGRLIRGVYRVGKHIVCDLDLRRAAFRCTVDCAPGDDGRLLVTTPEAPVAPHTHARLTCQRQGDSLCGSAPVWSAGVSRPGEERRVLGPGKEPSSLTRMICEAVSRAAARNQGGAAESVAAGGVGTFMPTRACTGPASVRVR